MKASNSQKHINIILLIYSSRDRLSLDGETTEEQLFATTVRQRAFAVAVGAVSSLGALGGTDAPPSFNYDRYGNRINYENFIGTNQQTLDNKTHPSIDPQKNRFDTGQGYSYDFNGNLISDAENRQFTFNGDNKQTEIKVNNEPIGRYFYDGEGKRVKKVTNLETVIFVYDGLGKIVAEYTTKQPPTNPTTSYTATDMLGSPRVITDSNGNVTSRRDFQPFGEEILPDGARRTATQKYGSSDGIRQKFTSYQRDEETLLDFAEARMYENRHARFTAVDPLLASGKSADPQTFNRYVYVMNNPLVLTDPDGLQAGVWAFRDHHANGGREYKHFNSQEEMDGYNRSGEGTGLCSAGGCTPYSAWTGENWVLWDNRTGAQLNDNGTQTPFSAELFSQDEWDQTVRDWYAGKKFDELTAGRLRNAVYESNREPSNGLVNTAIGLGKLFESFTGNNLDLTDSNLKQTQDSPMFQAAVIGSGFNNNRPNARIVFVDSSIRTVSTLEVGPFAVESIAARNTSRRFRVAEKTAINRIGNTHGCHTCGTPSPGTPGGNWILDHQPPSGLMAPGTPQRLYPHCFRCSNSQGGIVSGILSNRNNER